jgi:hypothetical protein
MLLRTQSDWQLLTAAAALDAAAAVAAGPFDVHRFTELRLTFPTEMPGWTGS